MEQSEIDALLKAASKGGAKPKKGQEPPAPVPQSATAAPTPQPAPKQEGQVITEIDAVTAVTERETNKVMDQLDVISQLVGRQQDLITTLMTQQAEGGSGQVQEALRQIAQSGKEIQDKVFEAMDLMQFQDITRQKLERIVYHLRQIHDYIVDLLGTGLKTEGGRASINPNIIHTGTTPDERKADADAVIAEFRRQSGKE
jgi:chemotaxis regulatin CheY-phosphate phosphatase CheZ